MDKYIEQLSNLHFDLLHIAQSYANDNNSPLIEPAHILRALLHKSAGLYNFIEDTLDSDYYYLVDWADMRIQQCDKSPYKMKGFDFSRESKSVIKEAKNISENAGLSQIDATCILVALITPGIAFSFEQLKTMPLKSDKVLSVIKGVSSNVTNEINTIAQSKIGIVESEYYYSLLNDSQETDIIGFDNEKRSLIEVLARKDRANILIVGETGVGKTSLIECLAQLIKKNQIPASLANLNPFELDVISLSQGVSYKGEIEDRFKDVVKNILNTPQPVLVIENFHRIEDKQSALNGLLPILKKLLSKNKIQLICTTTIDGYTKDIENDKELVAYFEKITVEEPTEELAVEIL